MNKKQFGRKNATIWYDGDTIDSSNVVCLQSYQTLVAVYVRDTNTVYQTPHWWSRTTTRQISDWWSLVKPYGATRVTCEPSEMWSKGNAQNVYWSIYSNGNLTIDCEVINVG